MLFPRNAWFLVCLLLVFNSSLTRAEDLIVSDFSGTAPGSNTPWTATSHLASGIGFSGWSFGLSTNGEGTIDDALGFNINGPADPMSTLAEAIQDGEYLSATITPPANGIDLSGMSVEFSIQRRSWHSPRQYAVLWSLDGFIESNLLFSTPFINSGDESVRDFDFFIPLTGYENVTQPFEIRIYAYAANYNHNTSLNAFAIREFNGQVFSLTVDTQGAGTATPTPNALLMAEGATVIINAQPDSGHHFSGFTGDIPTGAGKANPVRITMDSNKSITANFGQNPANQMIIGTNLGGHTDYGTDWLFVDWGLKFRNWLSRNSDSSGSWDSGIGWMAPRDTQGYPTQIPFDPGNGSPMQIIHTITWLPEIYGEYTLEWNGIGSMNVGANGTFTTLTTTDDGPHQHVFNYNGTNDPTFYIEVHQSGTGTTGQHLRDFHCWIPNGKTLNATSPFHPMYTDRLKDFKGLRFMDWAHTNSQTLSSWDNRTPYDYHPQTLGTGVAIEYMIELTNQMMQDPWFCIPHAADDNFIRQYARIIRDGIDPSLKIYIEYSNETWNSGGPFQQTVYVQDQGQALGLDADRWRAGQEFVAKRSVEMWEIFEEEFLDDSRLVKVMATQGANVNITNTRVGALHDSSLNPNQIMPDALAIAPYFGRNYFPSDIANNGYPTVDALVTTISQAEIENARQWTQAQKAVCDKQGWRLICYEGGQHFVGVGGGENDTTLTQLLQDANRDARMYDRYIEYLNMLEEEGVDYFCNFSYVGAWSKWGSWGVLESQEQSNDNAPKYKALIDWIAQNQTNASLMTAWWLY